jgi:hypothetical protein
MNHTHAIVIASDGKRPVKGLAIDGQAIQAIQEMGRGIKRPIPADVAAQALRDGVRRWGALTIVVRAL